MATPLYSALLGLGIVGTGSAMTIFTVAANQLVVVRSVSAWNTSHGFNDRFQLTTITYGLMEFTWSSADTPQKPLIQNFDGRLYVDSGEEIRLYSVVGVWSVRVGGYVFTKVP